MCAAQMGPPRWARIAGRTRAAQIGPVDAEQDDTGERQGVTAGAETPVVPADRREKRCHVPAQRSGSPPRAAGAACFSRAGARRRSGRSLMHKIGQPRTGPLRGQDHGSKHTLGRVLLVRSLTHRSIPTTSSIRPRPSAPSLRSSETLAAPRALARQCGSAAATRPCSGGTHAQRRSPRLS